MLDSLHSDHRHLLVGTGLNECASYGQSIDEAGAGSQCIKGDGVGETHLLLDNTGCRGEPVVGGHSADNNGVDFIVGALRHVDRPAERSNGHVRSAYAVIGDASFPDTGAGNDPFVRGVDYFLEISVGHSPWRHERPRSDYLGSHLLCHWSVQNGLLPVRP